MTKKELLNKLELLDLKDDATKKHMVCSLIGHSNIITNFFGYISCGRCEDHIGDSLMGFYKNDDCVIVDHDCAICRANFKRLTWRDKFLAEDPFPKKLAKI